MIKKQGDKYVLYDEKGTTILSIHHTRDEAKVHEMALSMCLSKRRN